jgi:GTP-binding protein
MDFPAAVLPLPRFNAATLLTTDQSPVMFIDKSKSSHAPVTAEEERRFQREKYRPKGGPSGGNGGRGGDVILRPIDLNNLINQYYQPRLLAEHRQQGFGKGMDGHAGRI